MNLILILRPTYVNSSGGIAIFCTMHNTMVHIFCATCDVVPWLLKKKSYFLAKLTDWYANRTGANNISRHILARGLKSQSTWIIAWKKHIPKTIFLQFLPRACSSKKSSVISVKARRMLALRPLGGSFVTWWHVTKRRQTGDEKNQS